MGDTLGPGWVRRLVGSHLMTDESVAFALAQHDPARRRTAYWLCGAALFIAWNVGVFVGTVAGQVVGNPDVLGLDAAFPAGLLALLQPAMRETVARRVALAGAVVALAATPWLPAGLQVLLGLVAAWPARPRKSR